MESYVSSLQQSWLSWFLKGLLVLGALVLIARLIDLQVIKGAYFRDLADNNRIRRIAITASRGNILSREGVLLADNEEIVRRVVFDPELGLVKVDAGSTDLSGDDLVEWKRTYPFGADLSHVVGYLGETNAQEVGKVTVGCEDKGVRALGSLVGRSGLEAFYDCALRGIDGEELVEVDTLGRRLRTLGRRESSPGHNIKTTIDLKLQRKVVETMEGAVGAVVVTDTKGEVLALYSSPSFDPERISDYVDSEDLPLFNRAIGGIYQPGSIFKLITSVAALSEGAIGEHYTYLDTGRVQIDEFTYNNWYFTQYGGVEGEIGLERALARSTDTFFYEVGELIGIQNLAKWARDFGLDDPYGIDLPGEAGGLVPDDNWKRAVKGERWFLGNTYHTAIGQGDLLVTPLAQNVVTSVVANNGILCDPKINFNREGVCRDLNISQDILDQVIDGMIAACKPDGTAFPFFDFEEKTGVLVACKTGTAETNVEDATHAWLSVFGPVLDPELTVTVLLEFGGEGSKDAGPIAREIMDFWFNP